MRSLQSSSRTTTTTHVERQGDGDAEARTPRGMVNGHDEVATGRRTQSPLPPRAAGRQGEYAKSK